LKVWNDVGVLLRSVPVAIAAILTVTGKPLGFNVNKFVASRSPLA